MVVQAFGFRQVLTVLGVLGVAWALIAPEASAADRFGTGPMLTNNAIVTTVGLIMNVGNRPVTLESPEIINFIAPNFPATTETCSAAPLEPSAKCYFAGSAGVYGGGVISVTRGSVNNLRGGCHLIDLMFPSPTVLFSEMH